LEIFTIRRPFIAQTGSENSLDLEALQSGKRHTSAKEAGLGAK
jgi:hypothetical protein